MCVLFQGSKAVSFALFRISMLCFYVYMYMLPILHVQWLLIWLWLGAWFNVQGLQLLDCLKCYCRGSLVSEAEKNWYTTHYLQATEVPILMLQYFTYVYGLCVILQPPPPPHLPSSLHCQRWPYPINQKTGCHFITFCMLLPWTLLVSMSNNSGLYLIIHP